MHICIVLKNGKLILTRCEASNMKIKKYTDLLYKINIHCSAIKQFSVVKKVNT